MGTLSKEFAKFIKNVSIETTPPETVLFAKQLAMKTLAGMVAGSATPSAKPVISYAKKVGHWSEDAGVYGSKFKCFIEYAILANGHFAHAAELEDDCFPSATSDVTVVPVVFPMAEHLKLSGKVVVESLLAGFETMNRLGKFPITYRGITELPFYGILGAAATAAKALNLTEEQIQNAIGISIARAAGYLANVGTDAHYFESSMACRDGYFAAAMAKEGLTGTHDIESWLKYLHGKDLPYEEQLKDLGGKSRWFTHDFWIKKYPNCFLTHRQIDITKALKQKYNIDPAKVEKVEVYVGDVDYRMCNRPELTDYESARFSYQHLLASVLVDGDLDFESFTDEMRDRPLVKDLRKKVEVILRKEDPLGAWMTGLADVRIHMSDGTVYQDKMEQAVGGWKSPLTTEQFIELYRKYTRRFLKESAIIKSADMILDLENQQNILPLMSILTFGK